MRATVSLGSALLFGLSVFACNSPTTTDGGADASATETSPSTDAMTEASADVACVPPADAATTCIVPCGPGNEMGVGRYCTRGGRQCEGNGRAIFCTVDFADTNLGYCTRPCSDDSMCGAGAICEHDPMGSGCIPAACSTPPDGGTTEAGMPTEGGARDASAVDGAPDGPATDAASQG